MGVDRPAERVARPSRPATFSSTGAAVARV